MAIKFDFYTGLRAGELLGLTWDCINFDKNTVRVNKQVQRNKNFSHRADTKTLLDFVYDTKTKTSTRTIKVLPQLMKDLEKYKNEQDKIRKKLGSDYYRFNLVFPRQDGYFTDTGTFLDNFARIQKNKWQSNQQQYLFLEFFLVFFLLGFLLLHLMYRPL